MSEKKWVFYPQGPVTRLIEELGPTHPEVKKFIETKGHDAGDGDFVEVEEEPKKHGMMDLKRGDE